MKTVLCIDYYFPPLIGGWVGGFKFIRLLPELGWKPLVISAHENVKYGKDYSMLESLPKSIEVHRVWHHEETRITRKFKAALGIDLDLPDSKKHWFLPALKKARELLRDRKIDLILTISPSFTTALIGRRLKQEFSVPWVAELQDAWSTNDYRELSQKHILVPLRNFGEAWIRRREREILEDADRIIVIHPSLKRDLTELHPVGPDKISVVTDGYCEADYGGLKSSVLYPGKLKVMFLGSSYSGYKEHVLSFARALAQVRKDSEFIVVGRAAGELSGAKETNVTLVDQLPKVKALSIASGADFLLLVVLPSANWHIPSKLYDYLRLAKPILALVPPAGDAADIIRSSRTGFVLSYEGDEMKEQLKLIFDQYSKGELKGFDPDRSYTSRFERTALSGQIVEILEQAAKQRRQTD